VRTLRSHLPLKRRPSSRFKNLAHYNYRVNSVNIFSAGVRFSETPCTRKVEWPSGWSSAGRKQTRTEAPGIQCPHGARMGKQIGGGAAGGSWREVEPIWQKEDERGRSGGLSRAGKSAARPAARIAATGSEFESAPSEGAARCAGRTGQEVGTALGGGRQAAGIGLCGDSRWWLSPQELWRRTPEAQRLAPAASRIIRFL
jgi:hypothetical protein